MTTRRIAGQFATPGSGGANGAAINVYEASRFASDPAFDDGAPDAAPPYLTIKASSAFGMPGGWRGFVDTSLEFWVQTSYGGHSYWNYEPAVGPAAVGALPLTGGTMTGPIVGLQDKGGQIYNAVSYGIVGDGATDDTAAWNSLFATIATETGGGGAAIYLPHDAHSICLGALVIPNDGGGPAPNNTNKFLRIFGAGGYSNGAWISASAGASSSISATTEPTDYTPTKIVTLGYGLLELDHLSLVSGGTDDLPFFLTTNTSVQHHHLYVSGNSAHSGASCKQDAFLIGGTSDSTDGTVTGKFNGYPYSVKEHYFDRIR
jgi:hypothetical protein